MSGPSPTSPVPLGADEVHVYRVDLDPDPPVSRPGDLLSAEEQAKAARFAFARDRRRYALSHRALRSVVGGYLSCDPREVSIAERPGHKPRLVGASDLRFNLSHSGEQALIGVTRGREIGIDLEQLRDLDDPGLLAARCFAPSELASWRKLPERARKAGFFTTWTRKEAYVKARGEGLKRPLESFEVTVGDLDPPCLLRDALDDAAPARWAFFDLDAGPGYAAAVAVEGTPVRVLYRTFIPEEEHGSRGVGGGRTVFRGPEPGAAVLHLARGQDPAQGMERRGSHGLPRGVPGPHPGSLERPAAGQRAQGALSGLGVRR
jgi:4'-phosphopantetheinyl transferase